MAEEKEQVKKATVKWKDGKQPIKNRFILKPRQPKELEFPFTDEDFSTLSNLVLNVCGIELKHHKKEMVYARLARRLRELDIKSFRDYVVYLNTSKGLSEIAGLVNAITTNLTRFYREPHHLDHLENILETDLLADLKSGKKNRIRIWSAGCSSGEEAYSIAYILDQFLKRNDLLEVDAKILATDIDTNMLEKARKGLFETASLEDVPSEFMSSFKQVEQPHKHYKIDPHLRSYIAFKTLNFKEDWPMRGPFDFIFCRNVMIYFDRDFKDQIIEKFTHLLTANGVLYVGHSETIKGYEQVLKQVGRTTYIKKT